MVSSVRSAFALGCLSLVAFAPLARADNTRLTNPNYLGFELLGRGVLWSIDYDRVVSDDIAAGFGFATNSTNGPFNATLFPAYFNYYFMRDAGSLFATAGATVVANSSDVDGAKTSTGSLVYNSSPIIPALGFGYENRSDAGFLVRFTAYALVTSKLYPWVGFSFGYTF